MNGFNAMFAENIGILFCVSLVFVLLAVALLITCNIKLRKLSRLYGEFMRGKDASSLEAVMINALAVSEQAVTAAEINSKQLKEQDVRIQGCVQKVGAVRYNAFADMGGDLSFSVALMNQKSNGIVMTSITGRQDNRFYCKPLVAGRSVYPLSPEEENAIREASGQ